jgi:hypothetical protein
MKAVPTSRTKDSLVVDLALRLKLRRSCLVRRWSAWLARLLRISQYSELTDARDKREH